MAAISSNEFFLVIILEGAKLPACALGAGPPREGALDCHLEGLADGYSSIATAAGASSTVLVSICTSWIINASRMQVSALGPGMSASRERGHFDQQCN